MKLRPQTTTGALALDPAWVFRLSDPHIAHLWKKSCGRPCLWMFIHLYIT